MNKLPYAMLFPITILCYNCCCAVAVVTAMLLMWLRTGRAWQWPTLRGPSTSLHCAGPGHGAASHGHDEWGDSIILSSSLCLSVWDNNNNLKTKGDQNMRRRSEERDQRTGRELTFNCFYLDLFCQVSPMQMLSSMCRILLDDCKSFHYA